MQRSSISRLSLVVFGLLLPLGQSVGLAQDQEKQAPPAKSDASPPQPQALAIPPVMTHSKELFTDADAERLAQELKKARFDSAVFPKARLNNASKEIIEKWARWRLYQMTLKSNRKRIYEIRKQLLYELGRAGESINAEAKDVVEFRRFVCEEITKRATELLDNNFHVRLNAVIVLAKLELTDYDRRKELKVQAFVGAAIPLLDVLNTETGGELDQQLEAVKIHAAIGLGRINLLGPPEDLNIRIENKLTGRTETLPNVIAGTLVEQLKDPKAHDWYQKRLIDSLATIDFDNNISKPMIVEQLGEVLADTDRDFSVRARAARGLGRCTLPKGINTQKLVYQILLLELEMALAYQKSPDDPHWHGCFSDVYYAFHAVSQQELDRFDRDRPPGLNRKGLGQVVNDAYSQIVPITRHVVEQPRWNVPNAIKADLKKNAPLPDQMIADLAEWLKSHQPTDHKLAPNLPDLAPTATIPSAGASTSS